jgi:hypothetical protein
MKMREARYGKVVSHFTVQALYDLSERRLEKSESVVI